MNCGRQDNKRRRLQHRWAADVYWVSIPTACCDVTCDFPLPGDPDTSQMLPGQSAPSPTVCNLHTREEGSIELSSLHHVPPPSAISGAFSTKRQCGLSHCQAHRTKAELACCGGQGRTIASRGARPVWKALNRQRFRRSHAVSSGTRMGGNASIATVSIACHVSGERQAARNVVTRHVRSGRGRSPIQCTILRTGRRLLKWYAVRYYRVPLDGSSLPRRCVGAVPRSGHFAEALSVSCVTWCAV